MRHILFYFPMPWLRDGQFTWLWLPIMGYGLMIVLGFASGTALAVWRAKRCNESPEHIMNLALLALVGGIGGARLLYVLENLREFTGHGLLGNIVAMVNVRSGGLVYYGGLLTATALALVYIYRKRLSTRRVLDILAPSLMLGLAFGRAGCFLNGCCYGGKCTLFEDARVQRIKAQIAGDSAPPPSWFEELMTASLVRFPYGSPAYEQQAGELPWRLVNSDGQVYGYIVRRKFRSGRRDLPLRVPLEDGRQIDGLHLDVPITLLATGEPRVIESLPWRVVDERDRLLGYMTTEAVQQHVEPVFGPDGRIIDITEKLGPLPLAASAPAAGQTVDVHISDIVNTNEGLQVNHRRLDRDQFAEMDAESRRLAGTVTALPIYPVQLYGMFNALLLCVVLSVFFARRWREGQVFALMLILKPITRFLLEGVRQDTGPVSLGMTLSQNISLYMLIAGVLMWVALYYLPAVAPVPQTRRVVASGQ